ncbi:hypothetical protein ABVT39_016142 [Epinephelus coioides]
MVQVVDALSGSPSDDEAWLADLTLLHLRVDGLAEGGQERGSWSVFGVETADAKTTGRSITGLTTDNACRMPL